MTANRADIGQETAETSRWLRWLRNAAPTLVISAALAATFYSHALLRDRAADHMLAQIRLDSSGLADEMQGRIDRAAQFLAAAAAFHEASQEVTAEEFAGFTGLVHGSTNLPGIDYIAFVDAAAQQAGSHVPRHGAVFNPRRLADAAPPDQQPAWRAAIDEAARQRQLQLSPVLRLSIAGNGPGSDQPGDIGLFVAMPVPQPGGSELAGYLVLQLDLGALLAEPHAPRRERVGLRLTSNDQQVALERNTSLPALPALPGSPDSSQLLLFGTPWQLETWGLAAMPLSGETRLANLMLTGGILVSLLLFFATLAQKRARIAADRSRQQMLDALESINDAFAVYDRDDRLVVWNSKYVGSYPNGSRLIRPGIRYGDLLRGAVALGDYPDLKPDDMPGLERFSGQPRELRLCDGRWLSIREHRTSEGGVAVLRSDITAGKRHEALLISQLGILENIMRGGRLTGQLGEVLAWLEANIPGARASLHRLDTEGRRFASTLSTSLPAAYSDQVTGIEIGAGHGSCGTAAATRQPVYAVDIASDANWVGFAYLVEPFGLHACWSMPIIGETGHVFGTIAVYFEQPRAPSDTDRHILGIAANLARLTLERDAYLGRLTNLAKMEAVDRLSGGIAHDFNNLLQVIEQATGLLRDQLTDERQRLLADLTLEAARKGAALTQRLLQFARGQPLQLGGFDLVQAIRHLEPLLRQACGPHVELELRLEDGLAGVNSDRTLLETALLNLAINARDAMPDGGRLILALDRLLIDAKDTALGLEPGLYARIALTDTGTGMDSETLRNAVTPYFTTKPVGRGSGLGLSMVYGFARETGGALHLRSQPAAGTTVTLYLPLAKS